MLVVVVCWRCVGGVLVVVVVVCGCWLLCDGCCGGMMVKMV